MNQSKIEKLAALFQALRLLQKNNANAVNALSGDLRTAVQQAKEFLDKNFDAGTSDSDAPTKTFKEPDLKGKDPDPRVAKLDDMLKRIIALTDASGKPKDEAELDKIFKDFEIFHVEYKSHLGAWEKDEKFVAQNEANINQLKGMVELFDSKFKDWNKDRRVVVEKVIGPKKTITWEWSVREDKGHKLVHKREEMDIVLMELGVHPDSKPDDKITNYSQGVQAAKAKGNKSVAKYLKAATRLDKAETATVKLSITLQKEHIKHNGTIKKTVLSIVSVTPTVSQLTGDGEGQLSFTVPETKPINSETESKYAVKIELKRSKATVRTFSLETLIGGLFNASNTVVEQERNDHQNPNLIDDPNNPGRQIVDERAEKLDDVEKVITDIQAGYNAVRGAFVEGEAPEVKQFAGFALILHNGENPSAEVVLNLPQNLAEFEYARVSGGKKYVYTSTHTSKEKLQKEIDDFLK